MNLERFEAADVGLAVVTERDTYAAANDNLSSSSQD